MKIKKKQLKKIIVEEISNILKESQREEGQATSIATEVASLSSAKQKAAAEAAVEELTPEGAEALLASIGTISEDSKLGPMNPESEDKHYANAVLDSLIAMGPGVFLAQQLGNTPLAVAGVLGGAISGLGMEFVKRLLKKRAAKKKESEPISESLVRTLRNLGIGAAIFTGAALGTAAPAYAGGSPKGKAPMTQKSVAMDVDFFKGLMHLLTYDGTNKEEKQLSDIYRKGAGITEAPGHDLSMKVGAAYDSILHGTKVSGETARIKKEMEGLQKHLKKSPNLYKQIKDMGKNVQLGG